MGVKRKDRVPGIPKTGEMNKRDREGMASEGGGLGEYSLGKPSDKSLSKWRNWSTVSNAAASKMSTKRWLWL